MSRLRNAVARAVNDVLRSVNLAVVRRDRHEALARGQQQHERQALGRDARPLHESVRTLEPASVGLLAGSQPAGAHTLGQTVVIVGRSRDAEMLADALRTSGRTVSLTGAEALAGALAQASAGADIVVVEPAATPDAYELVHRLRFEQGRRAFTADQLLGGAALFEAINQLVGVYVQPLSKALGYMAGDPVWDPIVRLAQREPLAGKRVVEFGPLDGCMTGSLVASGVASVTCVEVRLANVLKVLVARQMLGWQNVDLVIDDMHNVDGNAYGTFDVVVAHGVYYHSSAPFRFLENLTTLGDTIFLGGYCADPDQPRAPLVTLRHGEYTARAQPFREKLANDGAGVHAAGYYFVPADLIRLFEGWGFDVETVDLETVPVERQASQYLRLIARRRN
ncbi:MAG: class I SAM-dependent methyltransferase [Chloroflexota bacterium]